MYLDGPKVHVGVSNHYEVWIDASFQFEGDAVEYLMYGPLDVIAGIHPITIIDDRD